MAKKCFLDFEFNDSKEKYLNLVSCDIRTSEGAHEVYWLHNNLKEQVRLSNDIQDYIDEGYIFVAYSAIAEVRSILSLPNAPLVEGSLWIDLWLEYRNLLNNNNKYSYGKQLRKGKEITTFPKVWSRDNKSDGRDHSQPEDNYAAACYKLLDVKVDTDRKKEVRDIIISADEELIEASKQEILDYNADDTINLPFLLNKILSIYKKSYRKSDHENIRGWMLNRGNYAMRSGFMERDGYALNYEFTRNFADSVGDILGDVQAEINELFPEVKPFKKNLKTGVYTWDQKKTKEWIETTPYVDKWEKTKPSERFPQGQLSLSLDAFTPFYNHRHSFPKDSLGAQFVRYLKLKQNLNGFSANTTKSTIWDSIGSDGRVRPYMNIYRSQSSRSQPSSTSFMFLKSAWMRALVQPIAGKAMGGIDWKSQEFLIAAYESGDMAMEEAYFTGDVYLWFGKACKKIPQDATKKSHAKLRDRFKSSVLGIMYLMGKDSLAIKISTDTGEECTPDEAQEYIDMFDEIFWRYAEYRDEIWANYVETGQIILADGFTMWGDNDNHRSVKNCPIQGKGACIMRKAVEFAQEEGLTVPFTLHDALYIEDNTEEMAGSMDILAKAMDDACKFYYPGKRPALLDGSIWSPDFTDEDGEVSTYLGMKLKRQQIYIDGRGREEYESFKKYFIRDEILDLL